MALTLDKAHTALLAMDFQNDIIHETGKFKDFGAPAMVKQGDVLGKMGRLLDAARRAGVKVIYVMVQFRPGHPELRKPPAPILAGAVQMGALVEGTWGAAIHTAVAPKGGDFVVTKRGISAFCASDLSAILRNAGIRTLLLTGVATNFVVEGTAREAADRGYQVVVVQDCCAAFNKESHEMSLKNALPFLATITTSEEVIAALK